MPAQTKTKTKTKKPTPSKPARTISSKATKAARSAPGDLPPKGALHEAPKEWVEPTRSRKSPTGSRPRGAQVTGQKAVAAEIGNSTSYTKDFGTKAPSPDTLTFLLTNAAKWRDVWTVTLRFAAYAAAQRAAWEDEAAAQMDILKPVFDFVVGRDASVGNRYKATGKYLAVGSTISKRAASTKKKKKAASKQGAPENTPEPAPAEAAAKAS
ncbi:MAG TPA: hypothetical protein VGI39_36205 [Polyangiaceae bacterium]|jgi:hypothetical protein